MFTYVYVCNNIFEYVFECVLNELLSLFKLAADQAYLYQPRLGRFQMITAENTAGTTYNYVHKLK